MNRLLPLILLCALPLLTSRACAADEEEGDEEPPKTLEVGFRGSMGREANTRDFDWGPTLSYAILTSPEHHVTRFKYELEASYNDASTEFKGSDSNESTRVRSAEFRYAKISLLELFNFDLRKRIGIVPYVAGGIQYVNSRQDSTSYDEDVEAIVTTSIRQRYWSATVGIGGEVALNKKVSLAIDYDQNSEGGDRRVSRLSFELKVAVFGGEQ